MYNKYYFRRALWLLIFSCSFAVAGGPDYLGFTLNIDTHGDVINKLKNRHAMHNERYGYRGYSSDLPIIKVTRDPLINQYGEIHEAWLSFTPNKKLYKINITWRDAGKTYTIIKEVFDGKYQLQKNTGRGFVKSHTYKNNDTEIVLTRNNFGFGTDQKTSVQYLYLPAVDVVEKTKAKIDTQIQRKRVKSNTLNL